ncbi:hypothetical protein PPL_01690 [Heterostelium album PN500]|uniref:Uncharacterized protein n=1 Tax=Heterostelium pallidum (strain ATCC 26659 / Pp 5 / PN500) TaxID=670386 RepID=D3B074_HETP5|nr:hypothetical protein PPL_01690 [Heterostelium album PN500]EFA84698.1 hypothetical protein PPL_01690 [Heterostelium album PN500]|eukprot:XP_020436811.1 hypothetical protein PPL_01690 [Heterostelium album PN500]
MEKIDERIQQSKNFIQDESLNSSARVELIEEQQRAFLNVYRVNNNNIIIGNSTHPCKELGEQALHCLQNEADQLNCHNIINCLTDWDDVNIVMVVIVIVILMIMMMMMWMGGCFEFSDTKLSYYLINHYAVGV